MRLRELAEATCIASAKLAHCLRRGEGVFVKRTEAGGHWSLLPSAMPRDDAGAPAVRVKRFVKQHPGCTVSEIAKKCSLSLKQAFELLDDETTFRYEHEAYGRAYWLREPLRRDDACMMPQSITVSVGRKRGHGGLGS